MASLIFDSYFDDLNKGNIVPNSDTFKGMLVTSTYTPNKGTHTKRSDVTNEVSGTGYTAGGNTLANPTITLGGTGLVTIDFDDPATWSQNAAGFTNGRRFVAYFARGGASSADELIGYSDDFAADKGNVDGDFSATVNASGLFTAPR